MPMLFTFLFWLCKHFDCKSTLQLLFFIWFDSKKTKVTDNNILPRSVGYKLLYVRRRTWENGTARGKLWRQNADTNMIGRVRFVPTVSVKYPWSWPARSPDLSLIEHLWNMMMSRRLRLLPRAPNSLEEPRHQLEVI
jgi:hypothetical protein